jgi:hypothetical protein
VRDWQLRAAVDRGFLQPPTQRAGKFILWGEADLERARAALAEAGYLPAAGV